MEERADTDLVARARAGDKQAFDCLVARYQGMAARVALGMVAHEETARDLVQEAMLQAYLSLDRLRDGQRFRSWLYGIVLNVCRSHLRDRKGDALSLEDLAGGRRLPAAWFDAVPDPREIAEEREMQRKVLDAIQALSPRDRMATLLFYYEQWSVREIATASGVSVDAVKDRLHRVRRRLRQRLLTEYPEMDGARPRRERSTMVKARIASVCRTREGGVGAFVMLLEESGQRVVPIWIGIPEALAISIGLEGATLPRPLSHDLALKMLEATGGELQEVRVEALRDETYFAVVKLRRGKKVTELDARPSDALALAVRVGCPIYVAEEVLREHGTVAPEFTRYEIFVPLPFDDAARETIVAAQEEARRFGEHRVGTEHLLLAVLRQPEGAGARLLERMDLSLDRVRAATEEGMTRGENGEDQEFQYTPLCRSAIQLASLEAFGPPHRGIGTPHLVLGILAQEDGWGGRVLSQLGVDLEEARREIAAMKEG